MFHQSRRPVPLCEVPLLPALLWQGELGIALRCQGLVPDGPANRALVPAAQARAFSQQAAREAELAACQSALDAQFPGARLAMSLVVPPECFGVVLHGLSAVPAISPYDRWNVRFHPADAETARRTGLPLPRDPRVGVEAIAARIAQIVAGKPAGAASSGLATLADALWQDRID